MICVTKSKGGLELIIGPHVLPMAQEEAGQLVELIRNSGYGSFGPWCKKEAGAYDHPWENRCRIIIQHGARKWHFTESELEDLLDQLVKNLES